MRSLLLAVLAVLIALSCANYQNGNLQVAEVYSHTFSTHSYSVHQLPYGITFSTMMFDAPTSDLVGVARHIPCPSGQTCNYNAAANDVLRIYASEDGPFVIQAVNSITNYTGTELLEVTDFDQSAPSGSVFASVSKFPSTFTLLRFADGAVIPTSFVPSSAPSLTTVAENVVYMVVQFAQNSITAINISNPAAVAVRQIAVPTMTTIYAVCASGSQLFVSGALTTPASPDMLYGVSVIDLTTDTIVSTLSVPVQHPELRPAACFLPTPNRVLVAFNNVSIDNNDLGSGREDKFVLASLLTSPLLYQSMTEFNLTLYASHMIDTSSRMLYIVTSGGQIAQIDYVTLQLQGRMTLHAQMGPSGWDNSRGVIPYLGVSVLVAPSLAYVSADWWGLLIRVHLNKFCDDDDFTCQPYTALMMNPYEIALIAAGCAVALGLTVLAYLCISGRLVFVRNPLHRADSTLLGLDSADSTSVNVVSTYGSVAQSPYPAASHMVQSAAKM